MLPMWSLRDSFISLLCAAAKAMGLLSESCGVNAFLLLTTNNPIDYLHETAAINALGRFEAGSTPSSITIPQPTHPYEN